MVLEKILESPLDSKEIQPKVHPKGNQSWIFIGRTDAEAETPILWPPDSKNWLIGKDPDAGKDWRWEEKGTTEDKTVGWHHRQEPEWAPGVGDGQGSLGYAIILRKNWKLTSLKLTLEPTSYLIGLSWLSFNFSPGTPSLHTHLDTCSAAYLDWDGLVSGGGNSEGIPSPWTR